MGGPSAYASSSPRNLTTLDNNCVPRKQTCRRVSDRLTGWLNLRDFVLRVGATITKKNKRPSYVVRVVRPGCPHTSVADFPQLNGVVGRQAGQRLERHSSRAWIALGFSRGYNRDRFQLPTHEIPWGSTMKPGR